MRGAGYARSGLVEYPSGDLPPDLPGLGRIQRTEDHVSYLDGYADQNLRMAKKMLEQQGEVNALRAAADLARRALRLALAEFDGHPPDIAKLYAGVHQAHETLAETPPEDAEEPAPRLEDARFGDGRSPPLGRFLRLVNEHGHPVYWDGKRWWDPTQSDGSLQSREAWPPDPYVYDGTEWRWVP